MATAGAVRHELAAAHAKCGIQYISAPVFGRPRWPPSAPEHPGRDPAAIRRVQPLFDAMGKKTWHLGPCRANRMSLVAGNLMVASVLTHG
jgi:3-hydroxyisobutyrate dehydrogenase-like beta-hydroxyacid dehydrogenase